MDSQVLLSRDNCFWKVWTTFLYSLRRWHDPHPSVYNIGSPILIFLIYPCFGAFCTIIGKGNTLMYHWVFCIVGVFDMILANLLEVSFFFNVSYPLSTILPWSNHKGFHIKVTFKVFYIDVQNDGVIQLTFKYIWQNTCSKILKDEHLWRPKHQTTTTKTTPPLPKL